MARVNIEQEAWKRVYKLADVVGVSAREALGTVGFLWGDSQEIIKTHGTRQEIIEWANLINLTDQEIEKWILGLEKSRFISLEKNDLFKIHGNEVQLESRAKHATKSSKGGKALKKKLAELKRLQAGNRSATGTPQPGHRGLNALQGITRHYNSIQDNALQGNLSLISENSEIPEIQKPATIPKEKTLGSKIWDSYSEEYLLVYKVEPVRNSRSNALCKQLGERLGEEAMEVVRFYVNHPKGFYAANLHALSFCINDAEALRTQWVRGKAITEADVKKYADQQTRSELYRKIAAGEI